MSKNNPKNKLLDFETTIYQSSRKKKKEKTIKNKNVQSSVSKNIFKAKCDLKTVSFFQKKLCVKKKLKLFLTFHSFVIIFSAKCCKQILRKKLKAKKTLVEFIVYVYGFML